MAQAGSSRLIAALTVVALLIARQAEAETPAAPPPGATTCSGCHAPAGSGGFLPINGRNAGELAASMAAFRSGELPSTLMGRLMKGFSPAEIQAIAAWIASQ
jgi:cytochrome c553